VAQYDVGEQAALVTGAAKRLGAAIVRQLHAEGMRVAIHCRGSVEQARELAAELNDKRRDSASVHCFDLHDETTPQKLIAEVVERHGGLHTLVNNASVFVPTPLHNTDRTQWRALLAANLEAPYFLSQTAAAELSRSNGNIVNLTDIYADRPPPGHSVYAISKAGLSMLTKSLALEMAPDVRVNAVAPGPILWPEQPADEAPRERVLLSTPLARCGTVDEVAKAVSYLARRATFTTGTTLPVDGGRRLSGY